MDCPGAARAAGRAMNAAARRTKALDCIFDFGGFRLELELGFECANELAVNERFNELSE